MEEREKMILFFFLNRVKIHYCPLIYASLNQVRVIFCPNERVLNANIYLSIFKRAS